MTATLSRILPHEDPAYAKARAIRNERERERAIAAIVPVVGMGVTWFGYSDRYVGTVIAVSKSGRVITVREDVSKLRNGFNSGAPDALVFVPGGFSAHVEGTPRYAYLSDPGGKVHRFSRRVATRNGIEVAKWVEVGRRRGRVAEIGYRDRFYDFNF